jgi:hypothetical protein
MSEILPILMAMHEVITGKRPRKSDAKGKEGHYSPFNLQQEVNRLTEPVNLESLREIEIGARQKANNEPPQSRSPSDAISS